MLKERLIKNRFTKMSEEEQTEFIRHLGECRSNALTRTPEQTKAKKQTTVKKPVKKKKKKPVKRITHKSKVKNQTDLFIKEAKEKGWI